MPRFKDPGTASTEASNPLSNDEVAAFVTPPSPEPSAPSLFDPPAMGAGMIGEPPAGYRVSWLRKNSRPFNKEFQPKPVERIFSSPEKAEAYKAEVTAQYAPSVVVCITPVFAVKAAREKRLKSRQTSLACKWPLQMRPR